jgi:hypothetical protein
MSVKVIDTTKRLLIFNLITMVTVAIIFLLLINIAEVNGAFWGLAVADEIMTDEDEIADNDACDEFEMDGDGKRYRKACDLVDGERHSEVIGITNVGRVLVITILSINSLLVIIKLFRYNNDEIGTVMQQQYQQPPLQQQYQQPPMQRPPPS